METVHIVTFNILNNSLDIDKRIEHFVDFLNSDTDQPTVLLLQEVLFGEYEKIKSAMNQLGYIYDVPPEEDVEFNYKKVSNGNAIFSKVPLSNPRYIQSPVLGLSTAYANICIDGITVHLMSYHGIWGAEREVGRIQELTYLSKVAQIIASRSEQTPIIVLGGDLNAEPDSSSFSYLTGKHLALDHSSVVWTAGINSAANSISQNSGSILKGHYAEITGKRNGIIDTEKMPDRLIDHILTYGWNFGKLGDFLQYSLYLNHKDWNLISDHRPVSAHIHIA